MNKKGGAEIALDCRVELAESILWDAESGELLWVNIHAGEIWHHNPASGRVDVRKLPKRIGAIGLRKRNGLLIAFADGFALLDFSTEALHPLATVEAIGASVRLNDGRCDRQGRFVCGGYNEAPDNAPIATVYRLDGDGSAHPILDRIRCSNSICFSPDGATIYFSDMPTGQILAYDYDIESGRPSNARVFCDKALCPGLPDGSVVDAEGCLWNARWGAGCVVRLTPDGSLDQSIEVPAMNVTCPAFGGRDYRTLYVATAHFQLNEEQRTREPHAGSLFAITPGAVGLPEPRYPL